MPRSLFPPPALCSSWESAFPRKPAPPSFDVRDRRTGRSPLSSSTPPPTSSAPSPTHPPTAHQLQSTSYDAAFDADCPAPFDLSRYRPYPAATSFPAQPLSTSPLYTALPPPPPLTSQLTDDLSTHPPTHPTPSPHPSSPSSPPNLSWNSRFQTALELPETTESSTLTKYAALSALSSDFLSLARTYGRTIISEYFLPRHQQTIQPNPHLGGWAGGRKFTARGILFKLCNDVQLSSGQWLYGGGACDVESANKVGSHEVRSAIRCFSHHAEGVRVPMMALVEWGGYRVLAMPLLPLPPHPSTPPLLGSNDGGHTVHSDDPHLTSLVTSLATHLHLAPHRINQCEVHTAGDVEGHLGTDGRYYLLDLARCCPPESPAVSAPLSPRSVLYRLLRPELLQLLKADGEPPLSCDAFTQWGATEADLHNARVTQATRLLYDRYLPALAEKLVTGHRTKADQQLMDEGEEEEPMNTDVGSAPSASLYPATFDADLELQAEGVDIRFLRLSEELHCHGLNVRHLGRLRHHILTHFGEASNASDVALLLLVEMVGRALKGLLRQRLRRCMEQVQRDSQSADYSALRETVDFLNLCSSQHPQSTAFWALDVVQALHARFTPLCLSEPEAQSLFTLITPHLLRVLSYLCMACGIALSPSCEASLSLAPAGYEFTVVDAELRVQCVKGMAIADYAEARVLMAEAATRPTSSVRLMTLAAQIFDRLRHSDPFNAQYKKEARTCRRMLTHMQAEQGERSSPSQVDGQPWLSSQSSHSQPSASLSVQAIRTGLSTGFARFSLIPSLLPHAPPHHPPHPPIDPHASASSQSAMTDAPEPLPTTTAAPSLPPLAEASPPLLTSTSRKPTAAARQRGRGVRSEKEGEGEFGESLRPATRAATRLAGKEGKRARGEEVSKAAAASSQPVHSSPRKRKR